MKIKTNVGLNVVISWLYARHSAISMVLIVGDIFLTLPLDLLPRFDTADSAVPVSPVSLLSLTIFS